tara:strand:- start:1749 stop:2894 length:1146 start_codon:yes stop_codon:yes gene_type:complete
MILFINKRFNNRNGAEKSGSDVVNSIYKSGFPLSLSYIDINNNFDDIDNIKKIKILKSPRLKKSINKISFKELFDFTEGKLFDKIRINKIKSLKISLIIANSLSAESHAKKLANILNIKSCLIVRESPDFYKNPNLSVNRILFFNHIVFVSSNVMNQWTKISPELKLKSEYIPNTVKESSIKKIKSKSKSFFKNKLCFSQNDINVVIVGKFLERKNQNLIINNLDKFYKLNKNIKFHFIGKHFNSYGKKMKSTLKRNKYKKMVALHGFKKNAHEYIYASDYLFLTAIAEASPRVVYESMLLNSIVIASDVGGVSELIDKNKTGYIYERNNIDELIDIFYNSINKKNYITILQNAEKKYFNYFSNQIHKENYKKMLTFLYNN